MITKKPTPRTVKNGDAESDVSSLNLRDLRPLLFNHELSLLAFYRRVLEEALDDTQPLLERLKFLSIFSSNLDEFFMIRVSGLKEALDEGVTKLSPDGMTPKEQLKEIRNRLLPLLAESTRALKVEILPALQSAGIIVAPYESLSEAEKDRLKEYFMRRIFPMLTPQAVDPGHPFPYISGLSLNLGLMVGPVRAHGITQSLTGKPDPRFTRIKLPPLVPRLVPVSESESKFVLLEELVAANTSALFPRMHPGKCCTFRITRDADVEIREDEANDLLMVLEQSLRKRRFGSPVKLEVSSEMPEEMVSLLVNELGLTDEDIYTVDGPLDITGLMSLYDLDRPELKDKRFTPTIPAVLKRQASIFEIIKEQDVLLHHPYQSYTAVTDFIKAAAEDPNVVAIKMCLYRTGKNSPIPQMLIEASEHGKQVTALVELKARFDEENNIEWAKQLEESGVHVVYGVVGLKTHCKVVLVVRNEADRLRQYVHIATGNYNPITSSSYTDVGLLTADEEIGADVTDLFNYLTGFSRQKKYRQLLVAPVNLRESFLALINRETAHARAGHPARIITMINRLVDIEIIRALYEASQAGVPIDLIVRGICMLKPGVPGLSETINVRSIVGRFLEHSRIYYFANAGADDVYIGSADWMPRNFDRRIEVVAPIKDPQLKRHLVEDVLNVYLRDNLKARQLLSDGSYRRVSPRQGEARINSQEYLIGS